MVLTVLGYIGVMIMGISLGLIGGGGSIFAVPILVYLFRFEARLATNYSLLLVGGTALAGMLQHAKKKLVDYPVLLKFGVPSTLAVFATRFWLVPAIPNQILISTDLQLSKNSFLLLSFAILMLFAAWHMFRTANSSNTKKTNNTIENNNTSLPNQTQFTTIGIFTGCVTGLLGAGGGFIITPALVLFAHLTMKQAIATALGVIALNALLGFAVSLLHPYPLNWPFLAAVLAVALLGIFIGVKLSTKFNNKSLKTIFAYAILLMAVFILINELILK